MPEYKKLVRDNIPQLIMRNGQKPKFYELHGCSRIGPLKDKLVEESTELQKAKSRGQIIEEIADVKEVYDALLKVLHINPQEVRRMQEKKRATNGGFDKHYFLESVELRPGPH